MLRGEGVTSEDMSMEDFITREENFPEGALGFSSIILKKNEKRLFQMEVRSSIKTN